MNIGRVTLGAALLLVVGGLLATWIGEPEIIERFVDLDGSGQSLAIPNLETQRRISQAVRVSAIADVLQTLAGGLTIGLLFFTLRETRKSTAAALNVARTSAEAIGSERATGTAYLYARFLDGISIQNYGNSPATRVDVKHWKAKTAAPPTNDGTGEFIVEPHAGSSDRIITPIPALAGGESRQVVDLHAESPVGHIYWIHVSFVDIYGRKRWSLTMMKICHMPGGGLRGFAYLYASSEDSGVAN